MKKLYKPIFIYCTSLIFLGLNSCDILEKLFLNLKMEETITASGNGPDIFETIFDCLTNYDVFNDNKDDIKSIKYVTASFRTLDSTPLNLGGNSISATLFDCAGNIILTESISMAQASDYKAPNNPYVFVLSDAEIAIFNQWLSEHSTCTQCDSQDLCSCFTAELRVQEVSPTGETFYSLTGTVEIVVEIEAEL